MFNSTYRFNTTILESKLDKGNNKIISPALINQPPAGSNYSTKNTLDFQQNLQFYYNTAQFNI